MGKKRLHFDQAAEREATDIGAKFMHSSDVVGDMSRAYGRDLSSVRIHTDGGAARGAAERGVDAFSTGKDIFFGRGAFDQSDPASRGLLAHELGHSLQQGVGGGGPAVAQSAPVGEAQGGLLDWFRGLFRKKKQPEMVISDHDPERDVLTGPMTATMTTQTGDDTTRSFQTTRSYALNEMLHGATREQLQDPLIRRLVLEDYNTNMNARLRSMNGKGKDEMDAAAFRRGAGELNSLNMVMSAMLPEDFSSQVMSVQKESGVEGALDFVGQSVSGNKDLMNFLAATNASFEGVDNYEDPETRSAMMMNNLVLRNVNGVIGARLGMEQRAKVAELKKRGITDEASLSDAERSVDKSDVIRAGKLQKELNTGKSESAGRVRNLLASLFRKRH